MNCSLMLLNEYLHPMLKNWYAQKEGVFPKWQCHHLQKTSNCPLVSGTWHCRYPHVTAFLIIRAELDHTLMRYSGMTSDIMLSTSINKEWADWLFRERVPSCSSRWIPGTHRLGHDTYSTGLFFFFFLISACKSTNKNTIQFGSTLS